MKLWLKIPCAYGHRRCALVRDPDDSLAEDAEGCPPSADGLSAQRLARFTELMSTSPALLAASLQHTAARADDLIGLIVQRMGADPAAGLRPHLAAAAAQYAVRSARPHAFSVHVEGAECAR
jgi:hypothetical protein